MRTVRIYLSAKCRLIDFLRLREMRDRRHTQHQDNRTKQSQKRMMPLPLVSRENTSHQKLLPTNWIANICSCRRLLFLFKKYVFMDFIST